MLKCRICSLDKDESNFYFRKDTNKFRLDCKSCILEIRKDYYTVNEEKILTREKTKRLENINEERAKDRAIYNKNKELINNQVRERRIINPEKFRESDNNRYERDKEKRKACSRRTYRNKSGHYIHIAKLRAFNKVRATPKWLTVEQKEQIKSFYEESSRLTKDTGVAYNVDHMVPINGKTVCGLHVPWNLRVITEEENFKKHNKLLDEFHVIDKRGDHDNHSS
jgi:hypothetical protein